MTEWNDEYARAAIKARDERIRELEARLKNHETYCPGLLARGARAEAEVERLKDERESADHSGCRAREEDLEAEVERLKKYLNEVGASGGRESGANRATERAAASTASASWTPRSARKEASP